MKRNIIYLMICSFIAIIFSVGNSFTVKAESEDNYLEVNIGDSVQTTEEKHLYITPTVSDAYNIHISYTGTGYNDFVGIGIYESDVNASFDPSSPYSYDVWNQLEYENYWKSGIDIDKYLKKGKKYWIDISPYGLNNQVQVDIAKSEKFFTYNGFYYEKYYYEDIVSGLIILGYDGEESDIVVPSTIDNISVTSIADDAFSGTEIENLTVSEGIRFIGKGMCTNCKNLKKVSFPSTLDGIEGTILRGCNNLSEIAINDNTEKNEYFYVKDNTLFSENGKSIYAIFGGKSQEYRVPVDVTDFDWDLCEDMSTEVLYITKCRKKLGDTTPSCLKEVHFSNPNCILGRYGYSDIVKHEENGTVYPKIYAPKGGSIESYCLENDIPFFEEGIYDSSTDKKIHDTILCDIGSWKSFNFDTWNGENYQDFEYDVKSTGLYYLGLAYKDGEWNEEITDVTSLPVESMFSYELIDNHGEIINAIESDTSNDLTLPGYIYYLTEGKKYTLRIKISDEYRNIGVSLHMEIRLTYEKEYKLGEQIKSELCEAGTQKEIYRFSVSKDGMYTFESSSEYIYNTERHCKIRIYEKKEDTVTLLKEGKEDLPVELKKGKTYYAIFIIRADYGDIIGDAAIISYEAILKRGAGDKQWITFITPIGTLDNGDSKCAYYLYEGITLEDIPEINYDHEKYEFLGWQYSDGNIYDVPKVINGEEQSLPNGVKNIYDYEVYEQGGFIAVFSTGDSYIVTYTVDTWDLYSPQDVVFQTYEIKKGDKIGDNIPNFIYSDIGRFDESYKVESWSIMKNLHQSDGTYTREELANYTPTKNIIIKANWDTAYNLTFKAEDGIFEDGSNEKTIEFFDSSRKIKTFNATKEGYILMYWETEGDDALYFTDVSASTLYTNGRKLYPIRQFRGDTKAVFTPIWIKSRKIKFISDDGYINGSPDEKEYNLEISYKEKIGQRIPSLYNRSGYRHMGWKSEKTGVTYSIDDIRNVVLDDDDTFIAVWSPLFKVSWQGNGGLAEFNNSMGYTVYTTEVIVGDKIAESYPHHPRKDEYDFVGWSIDGEDKILSLEEISDFTPQSDMTFIANWKEHSEEVTSEETTSEEKTSEEETSEEKTSEEKTSEDETGKENKSEESTSEEQKSEEPNSENKTQEKTDSQPTTSQQVNTTDTDKYTKTSTTQNPSNTLPSKGTKEESKDGSATYKVTGSIKTGGTTIATVTYEAPLNKYKNVSKIIVPSKVALSDGSTAVVTKISSKAFANNKKITSVTIPSSVTSIGKNAFAKCTGLKKVTIKGKGLKTIESSAFSGCTNLTSVTIGSEVTTIGKGAFQNCNKLTKIVIPSKVTDIGQNAFSGCSKLKNVTIKSSKVRKIGLYAFKGIKSDAKIKVPKKKLSQYTRMLTKSKIPNGVTITK